MVEVAGSAGLPVINKRVLESQWMMHFYEEFESLLLPDGRIHPEIQVLIDFSQRPKAGNGFRREVVIDAFPFLVAVRPEEKSLYVGTRKLGRELALLKAHELNAFLDKEAEKIFFNLKEHVEKISTISPAQFPSEIEWVAFREELPAYWEKNDWKDVDQEARVILKQLVKKVGDYSSSLFEKISDWGLGLTAQYDLIRVHLLKFLALLPSLDHDRSGREVKRNLLESLRRLKTDSDLLSMNKKRGARPLPLHLSILFSFAEVVAGFLPAHVLASVVRYLVRLMAKRFIAGESIYTSHKTLRDLRHSNRQATLDQLGELVVSSKEADEYFERVLQLIHGMKEHIPKGEKNAAGILCAHVSIKVSALSHEFRPHAFESTYSKVAPRLRRILVEAAREEVFINVDAEHYHYRNLVFRIYSKVLLETPELRDYQQTGIVIQAYLRDGASHLKDVVELARKRNLLMPIRLVKGAYWDAETIEGEAHQFIPPQFLNKEESDLHFRQLAWLTLKHGDSLQLAVGSHNLQDHAFVEALRKLRFPQAPMIEHQCLHMTYEALSHGLALMGWPTRNYMPIGNLLVGMAYLVRRIMENSSQVGVLSIMRSHQKAAGLVSPVEVHEKKKASNAIVHDSFLTQTKSDFATARPLRLFLDPERQALEHELRKFESHLHERQTEWKASADRLVTSSSIPELIIGTYKEQSASDVTAILDRAKAALNSSWWTKESNVIGRVAVILKAADLMLLRRNRLTALMMYEAGKTMTEAIADVDEAIDFLNFYARAETNLQLGHCKVTNRGIFGVIAPWNFPLAIPCGMAAAPLLAGNVVILKPAEQTPLIGRELHQLLLEAGVPSDVLYLVQGDGEKVGAPLVTHPDVAGIVFTGSKGVGTWIYQQAAGSVVEHYHHQIPMQKKVITEMGGKNAIIVTNNCELDETISGILYAAFGHAGQKCSAASRVIVHKEVKDALVKRLQEAVRDLKVGSSLDPATSVNPLISAYDQQRVRDAVAACRDEVIKYHGKILVDRSHERLQGHSVGPAVFELPLPAAKRKDSWAMREIFGPVIHVIEYESLIEAVELFNGTEYALTGGIYSQSQDDIDFLLKFLRAGNLYINRPNTGARVGIEPFGGFKLSGTGPKAGGKDYLPQFHFPLLPQEHRPVSVAWSAPTGYEVIPPRPSLISIPGRIARFDQFAKDFMNQYELLMGTVNEREKGEIASFVEWIKANLQDYLHSKHPNHVIPGQLSYNDKSLVKEAGVFVVLSNRPSQKVIYDLMGALALGSGVSVACATQPAYVIWKSIVDLAVKAGFSRANVDVALLSPEEIGKLLSMGHYSYVYAEHFDSYSKDLYKSIICKEAISQNMRLILSEVDGLIFEGPQTILDQFVWVRSIAVNTMRHGAPLELEA